jgi:alpha-1,2-mannosyltransferase
MLSRKLSNKIATHSELLRGIAIAIAAISIIVEWASTMIKARGDFLLHWEFGHRLLHGVFLYENGMHIPYPPAWAMLFAPFSIFPTRVAMPLFFIVGFCSLVVLLNVLERLTAGHFPVNGANTFWLTAAVLLILSRFVLRDFSDGGENLFINALTWGGLFFFIRRKPLPGGLLLGMAIALKCTPILFTGYLLLKRQWAALFASLMFAVLFFVSPALIMGPKAFVTQVTFWKNNILAGLSQTDPSTGVLGPEELHNKALKPMLARFLMRLPDGHPGRFPGAAHIDFFQLQPALAGLIVKLVTLISGLAVVWFFSRSPGDLASASALWECGIVSLLMLLFSPITWGEHCVGAIPGLWLIVLRMNTGGRIAPWLKWGFAFTVAMLILLNRAFIGFTLSELLESYHMITFCLIALTVIAFAFWKEAKEIKRPE